MRQFRYSFTVEETTCLEGMMARIMSDANASALEKRVAMLTFASCLRSREGEDGTVAPQLSVRGHGTSRATNAPITPSRRSPSPAGRPNPFIPEPTPPSSPTPELHREKAVTSVLCAYCAEDRARYCLRQCELCNRKDHICRECYRQDARACLDCATTSPASRETVEAQTKKEEPINPDGVRDGDDDDEGLPHPVTPERVRQALVVHSER